MTRSKLSGEEEEEEEEGVGSNIPSVANHLMLLSRCSRLLEYPPATERVFVCKSCARQFASFQALGGHRASHMKKPSPASREDKTKTRDNNKPAAVITEEFGVRGHRQQEGMGTLDHLAVKKAAGAKRVVLLDMNLPARDKPRTMARNKAVAWARVCR